MKEKYFKP